jgi:hypothetical protein
MYLFGHLKETAEGFCLRADLRPTEPLWCQTPNPSVWGKPLGKEVVFWPVYPHAGGEISPHQESGGIFDFRFRRTFRPADYPQGKTPDKRNEKVQPTTGDTPSKQGKSEFFSAPITHPNTIEAKTDPFEKMSKEP